MQYILSHDEYMKLINTKVDDKFIDQVTAIFQYFKLTTNLPCLRKEVPFDYCNSCELLNHMNASGIALNSNGIQCLFSGHNFNFSK